MADLLPTILTAFATTMATKGRLLLTLLMKHGNMFLVLLIVSCYEKMKNVNIIMRSTLNH